MDKKIKIAFVKFGGLSAGGTEKFLQTIAANLPQNEFDVDYFYCDSAPYLGSDFRHPDTDPERLQYMEDRGVKLIKFNVGAKDVRTRTHIWRDTDFWKVFNENNYQLIQTGRAGHPEYPFNKIRKTPIVDSLHLFAGVDNQFNISRVMHISDWSARKWIAAGGDVSRVVLVSHPIEIPSLKYENFKEKFELGQKFIYGFHQRNDNRIFSPIPLEAYKKIEGPNNMFLILGGGDLYQKQAAELGLKNIKFINHSADPKIVYGFLSALDVYAHGRKDGEVNSTAMAEAMYFGLPIISHFSDVNNGHVECIGDAGRVVANVEDYASELATLEQEPKYFEKLRQSARRRFIEKYELSGQMNNIITIYKNVVKNPFPLQFHRRVSSLRIWYFGFYSWVRLFNKLKRQNIF